MNETSLDTELLDEGDAFGALDGFAEDTNLFEDDALDDAFGDVMGDFYDPPPPPGQRVPGSPQARRQPARRRRSPTGPGLPPATGTRPGARPARGTATLAMLNSFTRNYVRTMIRRRRPIDCADLAIEIWIQFADRHSLPISFRVWDSTGRRWLVATRAGVHTARGRTRVRSFATTSAFIQWTQSNLGAAGLIGNTFSVAGGHRRAVAGDVFLWQWRHNTTRRLSRFGHTQILDSVTPGRGGPMTDQITVFQGNLPPVVPQRRVKPARFFYNQRSVTLSAGPHTGLPVGPGPRRFNAFRMLR
jgi:hypothetical protein